MNFNIKDFQKIRKTKSATNIKYLRFKKDRHPEAFKLIAMYNRTLDLENLINAFVKKEVLPVLEKK